MNKNSKMKMREGLKVYFSTPEKEITKKKLKKLYIKKKMSLQEIAFHIN